MKELPIAPIFKLKCSRDQNGYYKVFCFEVGKPTQYGVIYCVTTDPYKALQVYKHELKLLKCTGLFNIISVINKNLFKESEIFPNQNIMNLVLEKLKV